MADAMIVPERVLITGAAGQVGRIVQQVWPGARACDRTTLDVTDQGQVHRVIAGVQPQLVVHLAAYTAVDQAEADPVRADAVNHLGAGHVAEACAAVGSRLIALSTDYVFSGVAPQNGWTEDATPSPSNVYGASKLAGEQAVIRALPTASVLRTSWVISGHAPCFVRSILAAAQQHPSLSVVNDQHGGPTPAQDVVAAVVALAGLEPEAAAGIWHAGGQPFTTWHGLATAVVQAAGLSVPVHAVPTVPGQRAALRPTDSRLDSQKLSLATGWQSAWQDRLPGLVAEALAAMR